VIEINGTYDEVNRFATEVALTGNIAFANVNIRPYYVEGSKTLAFEVCEQLGWRAPEHVIVPVGSGALLHSTLRGLRELEQVGLIDGWNTRISAAQAGGCSPVVDAILRNRREITPVEKPETICKSLAIGDPADGHYAVDAVRSTHGAGRAPTDEQILDGIKLLAKTEGVFTEPAGGAAVAALKQLADDGEVESSEEVVLFITGNGLKTQENIAPALPRPHRIRPELDSFKELASGVLGSKIKWLEGA
jgi:threonine synthase